MNVWAIHFLRTNARGIPCEHEIYTPSICIPNTTFIWRRGANAKLRPKSPKFTGLFNGFGSSNAKTEATIRQNCGRELLA